MCMRDLCGACRERRKWNCAQFHGAQLIRCTRTAQSYAFHANARQQARTHVSRMCRRRRRVVIVVVAVLVVVGALLWRPCLILAVYSYNCTRECMHPNVQSCKSANVRRCMNDYACCQACNSQAYALVLCRLRRRRISSPRLVIPIALVEN